MSPRSPASFATARSLVSHLPGVEESSSCRKSALKVNGNLMARLREAGEPLVVASGVVTRAWRLPSIRRLLAAVVGTVVTLAAAPTAMRAQGAPPSPDIARGRVLFESQCARCHAIDGSGGMGPNLRRPQLRRVSNDSALVDLIQNGVPERGMPMMWMISSREAGLIAAYVRTLGRTAPEGPLPGDATRGAALFSGKGRCLRCHMVNGTGGSLGPDLSDVGAARSSAYLRRALLRPGEELPAGAPPGYVMGGEYTKWLPVRVVLADGTELSGVRVNEDAFTLQLRDMGNRLHSIDKGSVRSLERRHGASIMRSYQAIFSAEELDDVVKYLASLQGRQ